MKIPELLAPAGSYEAFLAAIENGADAVYMGGKEFNARYSAENFTESEIARAVEYAHVRGRRIYITLNILLDDSELEKAVDYAFRLQGLGIDGVIAQDLGLISLLAKTMPTLKLHASTQMTAHNTSGVEALGRMGIKRVVLARELSYGEVAHICRENPGMEMEIFVHGALCYSYSGQCLMSSIVGGRSGNRGRCAQPCRLEYEFMDQSQAKERGHLLSPADLCLLPHLREIIGSGVDSLKIEGRMKRAEYVATVTRIYREALDSFREDPAAWSVNDRDLKDLAAIFNRNFTDNQWEGPNLKVLSPKRPNNRGVLVGRVLMQQGDGITEIRLGEELRVGDGIEIWVTRGANPAATIDKMLVGNAEVQHAKAGQTVKIPLPGRLGPGDRVFRTHDSRLVALALESIQENRGENRIPITVRVRAVEGEKLKIELTDDKGNHGEALSSSPVMAARTKALSEDDLWDKVNRLGNTPFKIINREVDLGSGVMVPFSEINETRRRAVEQLLETRLAAVRPVEVDEATFQGLKKQMLNNRKTLQKTSSPALSVRVAEVNAGLAALKAGADRVYLSLLGLKGTINDPIGALCETGAAQGKEIYLEIPAILRDRDVFDWIEFEGFQITGLLVGNPGSLAEAKRLGYMAFVDYTMNPFNSWTVDLMAEQGAAGVCLSPELNLGQLRAMMPLRIPAEYIVHGQMALMVSEHCVAGTLKEGRCQGKCDRRVRTLRDNKGYVFPIANDRFCRLHLFNSRTTCLIEDIKLLMAYGLDLRIEALLDPPERVGKVVKVYREAMDNIVAGRMPDLIELKGVLEGIAPSPLTKLHLYRGVMQDEKHPAQA